MSAPVLDLEAFRAEKAAASAVCVGRVLIGRMHWQGRGVIVAVHGTPGRVPVRSLGGGVVMTGGSADVDVVWETGTRSRIPECMLDGLTAETVAADQVAAAVAKAEAKTAADKAAKLAEEERQRKAKAEHAAQHPELMPGSGAKVGAENIRRQLKRAFPGVKFSVRCDNNSIRVTWTLGPSEKAVAAITGKYQEGHFDGMTDCYNYDHSRTWPDVFGGARYVFTTRNDNGLQDQVTRWICERQGVACPAAVYHLGYDHEWIPRLARDLVAAADFQPGAEVVGVDIVEGVGYVLKFAAGVAS